MSKHADPVKNPEGSEVTPQVSNKPVHGASSGAPVVKPAVGEDTAKPE